MDAIYDSFEVRAVATRGMYESLIIHCLVQVRYGDRRSKYVGPLDIRPGIKLSIYVYGGNLCIYVITIANLLQLL